MTRTRNAALALLAVLLLATGLPAASAQVPVPDVVYETYEVPTDFDNDGDGTNETIHVEVTRDANVPNAPVILTYTPYAILAGQRAAEDSYAARYVPKGYARAVADVLGTRGSSGCWDYGGLDEQQSGVDLVNFLSDQSWSNGNVAMIGGSYDGTTANMVAARGNDAPGLKSIIPIVGISRWYDYAYSGGVRYFLNSERPTDEGFDTPFAFDFGFGRVPPIDYTDPDTALDAAVDRARPCDFAEHTDRGYVGPEYDEFWLERDYRKDAAKFRAATLLAHGWQDYNVKQETGVKLFQALPVDKPGTTGKEGVPFKQLYVYQSGHASPRGETWTNLLDNFLDHTLKGSNNGAQNAPTVFTEGRATTAAGTYETIPQRTDASWPPPGTRNVSLHLGRDTAGGTLTTTAGPSSQASYTDLSTTTEEVARATPQAELSWLSYASPALARDVRMADRAVLDVRIKVDRASAHLTPVLIDVAPNGTWRTVSRTFLDLAYRDGLATPKPVPVNQPLRAKVEFKPQDHTFRAGHRIGLLMQSSNTIWAVPDTPGATVTVLHQRRVSGAVTSGLHLPLVSPPARSAMFVQ